MAIWSDRCYLANPPELRDEVELFRLTLRLECPPWQDWLRTKRTGDKPTMDAALEGLYLAAEYQASKDAEQFDIATFYAVEVGKCVGFIHGLGARHYAESGVASARAARGKRHHDKSEQYDAIYEAYVRLRPKFTTERAAYDAIREDLNITTTDPTIRKAIKSAQSFGVFG